MSPSRTVPVGPMPSSATSTNDAWGPKRTAAHAKTPRDLGNGLGPRARNRRQALLQRQLGGAFGGKAGLNDDGIGPIFLHRGECRLELVAVVDLDRTDRSSGGFAAK